jgi:hypothetical protein
MAPKPTGYDPYPFVKDPYIDEIRDPWVDDV